MSTTTNRSYVMPPPNPTTETDATAELRIGIVGTGNVARRSYVPVLSSDPFVSLAYVNRTPAKAIAIAEEFGGEVLRSIAELAGWRPDTVFVLTSERDRYDAAMSLLECGVPRLFFEKPLVARYGQAHVCEEDFVAAREILARAKAARCETAMVFNYRFLDQSMLAKRLVAERELGRATAAMGLVHYACWSHCIDLVHHFAGPIAETVAMESKGSRQGGGIDATDLSAAFRTERDASGSLIGTAALPWGFPLFELTISYERGRIHLRGLDGEMELLDDALGRHERFTVPSQRSRWDQYEASFGKSIRAYIASLRSAQPPPVPGLAGLLELQVEAGMRRSIAQGRPVVLAAEFPLAP
jgi:predicted dehydrogenase